jgi:hypothetical protein
MDSLILDYILAHIARQGELWTEGEHANKLLDGRWKSEKNKRIKILENAEQYHRIWVIPCEKVPNDRWRQSV